MSEIDNLEIRIEASAKSANNTLDEMSEKIGSVAEKLKKVLPLSDGLNDIGKIDSSGLKEINNQLKNIAKSLDNTKKEKIKPKVDDTEIKKTEKSIDDLFDKFSKVGKNFDVSGLGLDELEKEAESAEKKVQRLHDRLEKKLSIEGSEKLGKSFETLVYDIQKATNQAEIYRETIEKINASKPKELDIPIHRGEDIKSQAPEIQNPNMSKTVSVAPSALQYNPEAMKAVYGEDAAELKNYTDVMEKFGRKASIAGQKLKELGNSSVTKKIKELSSNIKRTTGETNKFSSSFKKVTSGLKKSAGAIKKPISLLGKLKKSISGVKKQANKGMGLGKMIMSSVAFSAVFQAISAIKSAIAEGSNNLTQYSGEYNNSISSMVSSLLRLKNSFAAAFAPIINTVAPYISSFINMLSSALNKVGQFFAALTGKTVAVQSKKVWKDYGSSLKNVGSGASDASKGLDKAAESAKDFQDYTLGIDELNIQPKTDTNSSGGTGGSGSGGGVGTELSPQDMFKTVDVASGVSDFANKVKEAWAKADFTEIGLIIGNKLNSALNSIPWDSIQETTYRIGKSLATLLNGIVESDGLGNTLGKTLGESLNTAIIAVDSFVDNTHWDSVGKFLADGLVGAVESFNFGKLAKTISDIVVGVLDLFIGFVQGIDWIKLGNTVVQKTIEFFTSIDYAGITSKFFEGLGSALAGIAAFILGIIQEAWNSVVTWWKDVAYEDGEFTILGLLEGILNGFANIADWIKKNIFQPFIDGFKKIFGIHSPSTVMTEQGDYIVQGLANGISAKISMIIEFFEKNNRRN